jgi:hypothetical protein
MSLERIGSLFCLLIAALAPLSCHAPTSNAWQGSTVQPPPSNLVGPMSGALFYKSTDGVFHARAFIDVDNKSVRITSYKITTPGQPEKQTQIIKVRYWPTSIAELSNGTLCVAGKGPRNGNTIVETWAFDPPAQTGTSWKAASLRAIDEVYNELAAGRDVVESMIPLWGGPAAALLVKFNDSKDVYSLTLTGAYALVASPLFHQGVVYAPFLSTADGAWGGELVNGGFIYSFFLKEVPDPQASSMLLLEDSNKDGVIDGSVILTGAQFTALGYNLDAAWVSH